MKEGYDQEQLFKTLLTTTIARLTSGEMANDRIAEINLYTRKLILDLVSERPVVLR